MKKLVLLFFFVQCSLWCSSQIVLDTFATGLSVPVDIKNAGDNRLFVVQQSGIIKIFDTSGSYIRDFINIASIITAGGEQGLLGLAFDPHYSNNGFFYVNYTAIVTGETHISRFQVSSNPDSALFSSERVLLSIYQPFANHNGGHVAFGPDGYLYIGMGDGGAGGDPGNRAQNLDSLLGKMLRIDVSDTSVAYKNPSDNPFYGATAGRDEIWDYGLRNPWRWSFDRWNGDFWIGDVGQGFYEEIDFEPASTGGLNFGWHCYEGNHNYDATGCDLSATFTYPVLEIPHDSAAFAITGGYVYRGAEYSNLWGKYFFSDWNSVTYGLRSITHVGNNFYDSLVLHSPGSFVSFGEDKYGELYIADYGGVIYKMKGDSCSPVAVIHYVDTVLPCDGAPLNLYTPAGRSFHYQWLFNGNPVGTDSAGFNATSVGDYIVVTTDRNGCSATSAIVHILPCVGIMENESPLSFSLYPNPNSGQFTLSIAAVYRENIKAVITDAIGKVVYEKNFEINAGKNLIEINSALAKGVYTIKLSNESVNTLRSFIVK